MEEIDIHGGGEPAAGYEPPAITDLGTLADLTQGGSLAPSDGFGGAGATGTISS